MSQLIDLGKLRFFWAGEYNSATVYEQNDVIKYGGNVYVYTYTLAEAGHVPTDTDYWALMISGLKFEGEYDDSTTYQVGDGVAYGGIVYIAVADTTGNEPPNVTYWSQFADGIQYEGSYSGATSYQMNDIVTYGGKSYIAKQLTSGHVPTNTTYWDVLTEGIRGLGNYSGSTVYLPGDIVSYGGNVYLCTATTTAGTVPTNGSYWSLMSSGIKYIGAYNSGTAYKINELVTYGAKLYVAKSATTGNLPTNGTYWDQLVDGISAEGVYNNGTAYVPGDVVAYGANLYVNKLESTGNIPTNGTYWNLFQTSVASVGSYNSGSTYYIGDIVKYGANLYICKLQSTGNLPTNGTYFNTFNNGTQGAGTWSSGTTYYLGDIVSYGPNRYIAKRETVADAPDVSTSDWEVFTEGVNLRGNWATSTTYYINDIVNRGGTTYICLERHASGATFATDLAANKWIKFNSGINWRGEWEPATAYVIDDVVYNGVSSYIATADFTSDATDFTNDTDWDLLALGADYLPNQVGQSGKFLSTNGVAAVWASSGTLETLTVNDTLEVNGDTIAHGDLTVSARTVDVTNKIKTNNVVTLTTDGNHYFDSGDVVVITGVDVYPATDFDGTYTISATPSDTTFTYTKNGSNVGSTAVTGGTAVVTGAVAVTGNTHFTGNIETTGTTTSTGTVYVGAGAQNFENTAALTSPSAVMQITSDPASFGQLALHNTDNSSSTDLIAYASNGVDTAGWIDMGITGNNFDSATFGITGPNDGYIFVEAPAKRVATISNKALTNNVATLTTSAAHGFVVGRSVVVANVDATFNGTYTVTATPSNVTFRYAKTNANVASTSATGTATQATGDGNLVLATGGNGDVNGIILAAGGFESGTAQVEIIPNTGMHVLINTASTSAATGALIVDGGLGVAKDIHVGEDLHALGSVDFENADKIVFGTGSNAFYQTLTNPTMVITANAIDFAQVAFQNKGSAASSSTDFIAYANNGTDAAGWIDMGITSNNFSDPGFTITGANDGYIFMEAPVGTTGKGNLAIATGANGTENKIIFAAGGLDSNSSQMVITPGQNVRISIATPSTSPTTGAFQVVGGVGVQGDMNVQGNVSIQGTITFGGGGTTVSAANLAVTDPFVFVGNGNQADISDLGLITEHTVAVATITRTVSNKALTNNVATLTTTTAHTYRVGDVVVVSGVDATFNGTYSITAVTTTPSNTFSYAKTASNVGSTVSSGSAAVSARRVFDGVVRDATDNVVKFFQNAVTKPSTTVDFAEAGVTYADILVKAANVTGDLTVATNKLTVNSSTGAVGINNNLTVGGTAGITGILTATGAINAQNTLTVAGQTSLGATNVAGAMNVTGNMVVTGRFEVQEIREYVLDSTIGTVSANVLTADYSLGNIYWVNTAPTANFTVNLTNVPTDNLYSMSITVVVNQGATGYIPSAFQVDGTGQTLRWAAGTTPTPTSSANKLDVFSFTLIRRASAWIVIGSSVLNF